MKNNRSGQSAKTRASKAAKQTRHKLLNAIIVLGFLLMALSIAMNATSFYWRSASKASWRTILAKASRPGERRALKLERSLSVSGRGFAPNSKVKVLFDGEGVVEASADGAGNLNFRFDVPSGAEPGIHAVLLQGERPGGVPLSLLANAEIEPLSYAKVSSQPGEEIAFLIIEPIGLRAGVREGDSWTALAKGPSRVIGTAPIGRPGTTVIVGHGTMFGAPFGRLEKLRPGDRITIYTKDAFYIYKVTGRRVVEMDDASELRSGGKSQLALSAYATKYLSARRLFVLAELKEAFSF